MIFLAFLSQVLQEIILGSRQICRAHLLWQMRLVLLPFRQISIQSGPYWANHNCLSNIKLV